MFEHMGESALDYFPCRYGKSKLLFRGPKRQIDGAYCAILGGTETYGKFVETPFPALIEQQTGHKIVNLGCVNAGVDVFAGDTAVLDVVSGARVTVVQVLGAQNMSNRFYAVHPRRNDRFLRASALMKTIFREVDFTEFNFTRHMLTTLRDLAPDKFGVVLDELKTAWVARMTHLATKIEGKSILLHIEEHQPSDRLGSGPLFVDDDMLARVSPHYTDSLRIAASDIAQAQGTAGMVFSPLEEPAALEMPGPAMHREVAAALAPLVDRLMR